MPSAADLPEPLQFLAYRNAFELSDSRWQYDVERLANRLRNLLGASTDRAPTVNRLQALLRRPLLRVGRMTLPVRSVLLLVLAIAVLALTVVWIRESGGLVFPPLDRGTRTVPVPSSAPTPIYKEGLITYLTTEQDQKTLSVLQEDGTSTVLARGADVRVLAVSPDQRYLVVATSPEKEIGWPHGWASVLRFLQGSDLSVTVFSADGQVSNTLITDGYRVNAAYVADDRLLIASRSYDKTAITYTLALTDGSQPTLLYLSEDLGDLVTPTPTPAPQEQPSNSRSK